MEVVAQGGVQRPLPLLKLGIRVLRQRRDVSGLGCCRSPSRPQEGAQRLRAGSRWLCPGAPPVPFPAAPLAARPAWLGLGHKTGFVLDRTSVA